MYYVPFINSFLPLFIIFICIIEESSVGIFLFPDV